MDDRWIWASAAVAGALVVGAVTGIAVRRVLDRPGARPEVREIARPASLFVFWLAAAAGISLAVSATSPETLRRIPSDVLTWLPNVAVAGLFVIGGYAAAVATSVAIGGAAARASGQRQRFLERVIRVLIVGASAIVGLTQVGVNTTILNILIAGLVFGTAAALAGIAITGSRDVSASLAAGRALQSEIEVGDAIVAADIDGTVRAVTPTHLVLDDEAGGHLLVPFSHLVDAPIRVRGGSDRFST